MSEESSEHDQEVMEEIRSRSVDKRRAKGDGNTKSPNAFCDMCELEITGKEIWHGDNSFCLSCSDKLDAEFDMVRKEREVENGEENNTY